MQVSYIKLKLIIWLIRVIFQFLKKSMINLNLSFSNMDSKISRFIVIGLFSTFINYLIFNITYSLTGYIVLSSYFGYLMGLLNSFIFGKKWVFKVNAKISLIKKILYLIVYFSGGTIMTFVIYKLQLIGINYKLAWFIGLHFSLANNFLGSKYIVFNNQN